MGVLRMSERERSALASASVTRHLTRGAVGFGLIGSALTLTAALGPAMLPLSVPGLLVLRGCPTCWIAGLIETVSADRIERTCAGGGCTLRRGAGSLEVLRGWLD
jgi:hypothetical protein